MQLGWVRSVSTMSPCLVALATAPTVPSAPCKPPSPPPATFFPVLSSPGALSFAFRSLHHCSSSSSSSKRRRRRLVVRAGPPSTNSLILAFVLPLSLLLGTIFAAVRVADRLDEKYLEELAMNKLIMEEREAVDDEEEDDDEGDEDGGILLKEEEGIEAGSPRVRNRPRREA